MYEHKTEDQNYLTLNAFRSASVGYPVLIKAHKCNMHAKVKQVLLHCTLPVVKPELSYECLYF